MKRISSVLPCGAFLLAVTLSPASAPAQVQSSVTVDASRPLNVLGRETFGGYSQIGDNDLLEAKFLGSLRAAGVTTITYPTGWDTLSGMYHWSTHTVTAKVGNASASKTPYISPNNDFGHVALALEKAGISLIIHVAYASNAKGGGGEPKEAAAWVAYANGSPNSTVVIGKDSTGEDWKTVGYWAAMRASQPLAANDGYNFLRINHPAPLHIALWQIGEDVQENGFYGGEHKGTLDQHAPYPANAAQNESRRKVKELSPTFYGEQINAFATAMRAADPEVKIGATLVKPGLDTWATDWNEDILKAACQNIDFVAYSWHPGNAKGPDYKTLDDASVLTAPYQQLPQIISETLYEDKKFCPAGKVPRVVMADFAPVSYFTVEHPTVLALFAAESFASLAEAGISNSSWYQLREGGLFDKDGKPTPAYFGTQMIHIVAFRPGDAFLATSGAKPTLGVHATRRQDGAIGVLLANHDPDQAQIVKLTIAGADLAGTGLRFEYSPAQQSKSAGSERAPIKTEGNTLEVTVPAFGIVDVLLPLKK